MIYALLKKLGLQRWKPSFKKVSKRIKTFGQQFKSFGFKLGLLFKNVYVAISNKILESKEERGLFVRIATN